MTSRHSWLQTRDELIPSFFGEEKVDLIAVSREAGYNTLEITIGMAFGSEGLMAEGDYLRK